MEEVLECVVRDGGAMVADVARVLLAAVAIAAASAALGAVMIGVGLVRRARAGSPLLLGVGLMLAMPALWMAGAFAVALVT
jgi:hypothetical protein